MTALEARRLMYKVFRDAWVAAGYDVNNIRYTGLPGKDPTGELLWCRATLRHATGHQASLSNENNVRRWERTGTVFIQVFAPIGDGSVAGYNASEVLVNAYRKPGITQPTFLNPRMSEIGVNGAFEQFNVLADFSYDDVR
jgi:hypothetical protein